MKLVPALFSKLLRYAKKLFLYKILCMVNLKKVRFTISKLLSDTWNFIVVIHSMKTCIILHMKWNYFHCKDANTLSWKMRKNAICTTIHIHKTGQWKCITKQQYVFSFYKSDENLTQHHFTYARNTCRCNLLMARHHQ